MSETRAAVREVRRRRDDRRAELLAQLREAVARLTDAGTPFSEVSVEQFAAEAGISRSSFYRYFEDMGEVLAALSEGLMARRREIGNAIWTVMPAGDRERLGDAFLAFLRVCWDDRVVIGAVSDAQNHNPGIRALGSQIHQDAVDLVCDHIQRGQAEGWVRPGIQVRNTAEWLVAMNERGLAALVGRAEEGDLPALADGLTSIVWFTLYDGAARAPD